MTIQEIRKIITGNIVNIPYDNWTNYKSMCESFVVEMENKKRIFDYDDLFAELKSRMHNLRTQSSCTPPMLCKFVGESGDVWLNRCYKVGGYN